MQFEPLKLGLQKQNVNWLRVLVRVLFTVFLYTRLVRILRNNTWLVWIKGYLSSDVNLMRIHGNIDTVMLCSFYLNQERFFEKLILIGTQTAPFMFVTCYQNIGVGYNPQNQIILPRITNVHIKLLDSSNHFFIVNLDMKEGEATDGINVFNC